MAQDESKMKSLQKKKISHVYWTRDTTMQLIKLYESHSNLWDISSDNYRSRNLRKASIKQISKILGIPPDDINDKIHNLRCQFQSINRRFFNSKSTSASSNCCDRMKVKWEFYDAMKFIQDPKTNETISYLQQVLPNEETVNVEIQDETQDSSNNTIFKNSCSPIHSTAPSNNKEYRHNTSNKRKRHSNKRKHEEQNFFNHCIRLISNTSDSFQIFGDYVADELRNMNYKEPNLQEQAKRKIQRILLEMNEKRDILMNQSSD